MVGYEEHDLITDLEYFYVAAVDDYEQNNANNNIVSMAFLHHTPKGLPTQYYDFESWLLQINIFSPEVWFSEWETEFYWTAQRVLTYIDH